MHAFSKRWLSGKRLTGEAGLALAAITTWYDYLWMPWCLVLDGWAVLAGLKADPELADIPVIMLDYGG
jgi:CheY-like chemotaxis protein